MGVKKSFSGKIWNFIEFDENILSDFKARVQISDLVARIFINRGFQDPDDISQFINAKLKNTIPDPSLLLDMDKGVERIVKAIEQKQNIMILGDYDVDGITSTYLIVKYLNLIGLTPNYYIPNRFSDGYGVSENSIERAVQNKSNLIISVDSGINSIKEVDIANELGMDFIILDHHMQLSPQLPNAAAIINPNRVDQDEIGYSHIKNLCAAGVVFMFLIALQRKLKNIGFFDNIEEPNLLNFTDIVTLGTLCDVMDLRGINRALTKYTIAKNEYSMGISSLMNAFNIEKISSPEDLSFFIGPAINAAGRIGDPHVALNLLLEESSERSQKIAEQLIELNKKRKVIEKQLLSDAMFMIDEHKLEDNRGICVFGEGWNDGVIGIIAGRLKEKFQKPIFVISISESGIGKGSARSVNGIHLGKFFEKANACGIVINGGGHALAGGFSIKREKIAAFQEFINDQIEGEFINTLDIDYSLSVMSDLDQISKEISIIEPFGKGIEKPRFCFKKIRIKHSRKTNTGSHLMFTFSGEFDKGSLRAILFNSNSKSEIVDSIIQNDGELFDIAGTINYSEQFGSSIIIDDMRLSD